LSSRFHSSVWWTCSCLDCCRGCLSVSTAALLLVSSTMLRNLSFGSKLKARAIAATCSEYRFCSDLMPSVEEKVPSLEPPYTNSDNRIAPPIPTTSFRAELLTAMRIAQPVSACLATDSSAMVCTRFSHGANVNGLRCRCALSLDPPECS
jgi:hypothetical protein